MKLFPLAPLVFIAAYTFVGISIAMDYKNNSYAALTGIALLAVIVAVYFLFKHKGTTENKTDL